MKQCIRLISLSVILLLTQNVYAEKANIIDQDAYTDTETNFFDRQGNKVFLDQYEDKTVLLVFWATWCGSCISELASLENLAKDFRKLSFKIIALSQDYQGVEVVEKYFSEHDIRHLEIFHDYQNQLFRSMSVVSLPTAFLINSDGKIKKLFKGRIKWQDNEIRSILLDAIEGNPEMPKNSYQSPSLNMQVGKVIAPLLDEKIHDNTKEKQNEQETDRSK
jgi:thiol-disulfide isomerase/thioredoxin